MDDEDFDPNDLSASDDTPSAGALTTTPASLAVSAGDPYGDSPVAALQAATARLKAQRSGLSPQQQIAALLIGYGKPTQSGSWQAGVSNAAQTLMAQQIAARAADAKREDLISKYDLAAAHYGAQNEASTARTAELAQAAKDKATAAAAKAAQGTLQVSPPMYPGAPPMAVLKGFDANGPFVRSVPIGTPGSTPAAPASGDGVNPFPVKYGTGAELAAKYGIQGLTADSNYSFKTAGPEAGQATEIKPNDPLAQYHGLTGPALMAALPDDKRAEVQAIIDGRVLAPTTGTRGAQGAQLLALATAADPTFDASQAKAKFQTRNAFAPGGKYAQQLLSIDTVANHADNLATAAANLDNTQIPIANAVKNAVSGATGQSPPVVYNQAANAVANEMMKVFRGTGSGSTKDIADWQKTLSPNLSPDQQQGVIQGGLSLVVGRLKPMVDQWNSTMGENRSVLSFISPSARATFMKLDPSYQLTDDDKAFLNQQEVAKRTKARGVAPAAAAPSSATGGKPIPAPTLEQWKQVPEANKAAARAHLQQQGYDISGLT